MAAPRTLFGRTLVTIAIVSTLFFIFALAVIAKFLLLPVGHRSAGDLGALMAQSAEVWAALPRVERPAYVQAMEQEYGVLLREELPRLPPRGFALPYFVFLEEALSRHAGKTIRLRVEETDRETVYWSRLSPRPGDHVYMGIAQSHIGVQPPLAVFLVLSVGIIVTMATAVLLVYRLIAPLARLSRASRRLGGGDWPDPVPEEGPEELAEVARNFNRMVAQVRNLLANRTTLLAGISHDLRTPLARIQVAVEMLPTSLDPPLVDGIRRDVGEMNGLINRFLEVAQGLEKDEKQAVELPAFLEELAEAARRGGAPVELKVLGPPCRLQLSALALNRVVCNLVDNAWRYGGTGPVVVEYRCGPDGPQVHVLDRGPGIPSTEAEAVFAPFYRLEQSRNRRTGGSGLGLAIARQLAEANGWEVRLQARRSGGTRAVVTLGRACPPPAR